jgi:hypothetical protein
MLQLVVGFHDLASAHRRACDNVAAEHYSYVGLSSAAFDSNSEADIALGQCHVLRVMDCHNE